MTSGKPADPGFGGETDADLLAYMSMGGEDPVAARGAWSEFYRRHAEYLYAVCLRAYGPLLRGEAGVCDLVAETFKRVYEHAGRFDAALARRRSGPLYGMDPRTPRFFP
jgi:hypothetical protein